MKYEFQCLSWIAQDVNEEDEDSDDEGSTNKQYKISIFGRCSNGNSICVHTPFFPYFFVEVSDKWTENSLDFINFRKSIKSIYSDEIKNVKLVNRKKFFGFTNGQLFKFARIDFKTHNAFKRMSYVLKKPFKYAAGKTQRFNIYEANLDPMLRFCHIQDIKLAGWASVDTNKIIEVNHTTHCNTEILVPSWRDIKYEAIEKIAPIIQASFDIETYSYDGSFPDPNEEKCPCIQIATTLQRYGDPEPYRKHLISLGTCDPIEGVDVIQCKTEKRVLETWGKLIRDEDVDVLIGYNIWGFDLQYMFKRALRTEAKQFFELGRYIGKKSKLTSSSFSSGAYGDSDYEMVDTLGRFQIDLLVIMKREYKLRKYSLNFVAEHFLGDQKVDMPYKEMFKKYKGDSKDRHDVGVYCVKDTDLPIRLINKLAILPNLIEMSKATWVPLSFLIERGQGIKVFSQICYTTRKANMLVISPNKDIWTCSFCEHINNVKMNNNPVLECKQCKEIKPPEEPYEGATVLSAMRGAYMDDPITGLDFASLYPTIMRAHNLCHSTFVMSKVYDNIPGVNYAEFNGLKFVQDDEGILPLMLRILAESRKEAKKQMKAAASKGDTFMESVYNGKQLAFKVSMNSIYGFCGAIVGFLPCKQVASTTTSIGREMIEQTKNLAEEWYPGSVVVYGDSVTGDTPIILKINNKIQIIRIDCITEHYHQRSDDKEFSKMSNIEVWSDNGFVKLEQVVRHKTTKKMFRVLTHTGVVDVTEDHSLLLKDGSEIKPTDTSIGTELLHKDILDAFSNTFNKITVNEAKVMGFFFGDGSCGKYGEGKKVKYVWALNNSNLDYLLEMQNRAPFPTSVYATLNSSGVYKLNATGNVKEIVKKYRDLFYNSYKQKTIPSEILNSTCEIKQAFWDGYYMADGDKDTNGYIRCDTKGKEGAMGLFALGRSLGYNVSINTRLDKQDIFRLTYTTKTQRKNTIAIKKIIQLKDCDTYVYDLTTSNHHFSVGPGNLVVHNTDSVMTKFDCGDLKGKDAIKKSFELGEEAAARISATFKAPIELEFEKVYYPYLLFSKKRYAGLMYTNPEKPDYIDAKGIQLVRRDNCPFVSKVSNEVLNSIMYSLSTDEAINIAKKAAETLLSYQVPINDLIVSKSLRRIGYVKEKQQIPPGKKTIQCDGFLLTHEYANSNLPHITVARKREERDPGTGPKSGDRVPYVFIDTKNPKDLQYLKAEDPDFASENNLKPDVQYYLEHGLSSPLVSLMEVFIDNPKETLFNSALNKFNKKKNKQLDIYEFLGIV